MASFHQESQVQLETKLDDDFDIDQLESGKSKEVLKPNCLCPTPIGKNLPSVSSQGSDVGWHRCYIARPAKTQFRLYDERNGEMLLSAVKTTEGDFLISQYNNFPEEYAAFEKNKTGKGKLWNALTSSGSKGKPRYLCTLRLNSTRNGYKLYRNGCELCDDVLKKFSCFGLGTDLEEEDKDNAEVDQMFYDALSTVSISNSGQSNLYRPRRNSGNSVNGRSCRHGDDANRSKFTTKEDRQLLAVIHQSMQCIENTDIKARFCTLEIPGFFQKQNEVDYTQRVVWCPRTLNIASKSESPAEVHARLASGKSTQSDMPLTSTIHRRTSNLFTTKVTDKDRIRYVCKLPSWSDDVGSLVLTFNDGRVLEPSQKNFLMVEQNDDSKMMLQFGKVHKGKFNLDFKHPLSPLQAFALALTAFSFTVK